MKKIIIMLMLLAPMATFAQKFGHVDAQSIMQSMPEFIKARGDLEALSKQYENDLKAMMRTAAFEQNGPFVIRYPRGRRPGKAAEPHPAGPSEIGRGRCLKEGRGKTAILTLGPIGNVALEAAEGTDAAVWDMRYLKPFDESILRRIADEHERIVTVEDGVRNGGLGSAVAEWMNDQGCSIPVVRLGLPDSFVEQGTPEELYRLTGLDRNNIKQQIQ